MPSGLSSRATQPVITSHIQSWLASRLNEFNISNSHHVARHVIHLLLQDGVDASDLPSHCGVPWWPQSREAVLSPENSETINFNHMTGSAEGIARDVHPLAVGQSSSTSCLDYSWSSSVSSSSATTEDLKRSIAVEFLYEASDYEAGHGIEDLVDELCAKLRDCGTGAPPPCDPTMASLVSVACQLETFSSGDDSSQQCDSAVLQLASSLATTTAGSPPSEAASYFSAFPSLGESDGGTVMSPLPIWPKKKLDAAPPRASSSPRIPAAMAEAVPKILQAPVNVPSVCPPIFERKPNLYGIENKRTNSVADTPEIDSNVFDLALRASLERRRGTTGGLTVSWSNPAFQKTGYYEDNQPPFPESSPVDAFTTSVSEQQHPEPFFCLPKVAEVSVRPRASLTTNNNCMAPLNWRTGNKNNLAVPHRGNAISGNSSGVFGSAVSNLGPRSRTISTGSNASSAAEFGGPSSSASTASFSSSSTTSGVVTSSILTVKNNNISNGGSNNFRRAALQPSTLLQQQSPAKPHHTQQQQLNASWIEKDLVAIMDEFEPATVTKPQNVEAVQRPSNQQHLQKRRDSHQQELIYEQLLGDVLWEDCGGNFNHSPSIRPTAPLVEALRQQQQHCAPYTVSPNTHFIPIKRHRRDGSGLGSQDAVTASYGGDTADAVDDNEVTELEYQEAIAEIEDELVASESRLGAVASIVPGYQPFEREWPVETTALVQQPEKAPLRPSAILRPGIVGWPVNNSSPTTSSSANSTNSPSSFVPKFKVNMACDKSSQTDDLMGPLEAIRLDQQMTRAYRFAEQQNNIRQAPCPTQSPLASQLFGIVDTSSGNYKDVATSIDSSMNGSNVGNNGRANFCFSTLSMSVC